MIYGSGLPYSDSLRPVLAAMGSDACVFGVTGNAPVKNKTKVAVTPALEAKPPAVSTTSVPTTPVSAEIEVDKD